MNTRWSDIVLHRRVLAIALLVMASLYLYSLWHRDADIDDAWIGEHAYWLAKDGHARSELMRGITGQEEYLIVHHKLLTLHGALFIDTFGFSLYSLKAVSLTYFLLFLVLLWFYLSRVVQMKNGQQWLLIALVLISFPWIFKYSYVYRPEVMIMTLAFGNWILLEKCLGPGGGKKWLYAIAAGVLSGLCFTAHLNGIVVAGAGFLLLLLNRKWTASLAFAMGAGIGMTVYLYDFNPTYGWDYWWYQFSESPALDSLPDVSPFLQPFLNLMNEHQRFFHNPMIAFFSVFMLFGLIIGYRRLVETHKNMLVYVALLAALLGLSAMHKSRQYILVYFPFLVIMISDVYVSYFKSARCEHSFSGWRGNGFVRFLLLVAFAAYIISGFYYNLTYSRKKIYPEENRRIAAHFIPEDSHDIRIIAPMSFIFNEIENFKSIQSEVCYTEMQKSDPKIYGHGFLERTKSFDIRYIILSSQYINKLGMQGTENESLPAGFEVLSDAGDDYLVIKRN